MSRSPRRRKDTTWCRYCDEAITSRNGYGKHHSCERRRRRFRIAESDRKRIEKTDTEEA